MAWNWKHKTAAVSVVLLGLSAAAYWDYERNKDVIARVGDFTITQSEFLQEMYYRGGAFVHELDKQALLDEMIAKKLRLNKAYELGYHERADIKREYEYLLMGKVRHTFIDKERESISVDEEAMKRYYQEHRDDYHIPQKDRLAILFFKKRGSDAEKNTARLKEVQQLAKTGQLPVDAGDGFGKYAVSNSEHQVSRYKGGEIGWFSKGQDVFWEKPVLDAGFSLKQLGDLSDIVETDKGYYLVRLMEREAATYKSFEAVESRVRHKMILSEQSAVKGRFEKSLKQDFSISVNYEKLDEVTPDTRYAKDSQTVMPPVGALN